MSQIVPRFDFRVECGVADDIGRTREVHEDVALDAADLALFAVADGMGGHAAGEVAARLAVEEARDAIAGETSQRILEHYCTTPDVAARRNVLARLRRAVERANERVRAEAATSEERRGMGTTLDLVWLARDHAFIAHTGDSRVYLARASTVIQLTQDHAQLESLQAEGRVRPHGRPVTQNRLLNAVGLADEVVVDTLFVDLDRGDRLLLCTDGVHAQVGDEATLSQLLRSGSPLEAAGNLVARAALKGRDNATAIVIEIGDRFVARADEDRGLAAADLERARANPLLQNLTQSQVLGALAAAVEVEVDTGQTVPRVVANDLVAYLLLDGLVRKPEGRLLGTGALLFPESLVGVWGEGELPVVEQTARMLRVRADDFEEVCLADVTLGAELYRRLATHLARLGRPARGAPPSSNASSSPDAKKA